MVDFDCMMVDVFANAVGVVGAFVNAIGTLADGLVWSDDEVADAVAVNSVLVSDKVVVCVVFVEDGEIVVVPNEVEFGDFLMGSVAIVEGVDSLI